MSRKINGTKNFIYFFLSSDLLSSAFVRRSSTLFFAFFNPLSIIYTGKLLRLAQKKTFLLNTKLQKIWNQNIIYTFLMKNTLKATFYRFSKFFSCLIYVLHAPLFRVNIRLNQHWTLVQRAALKFCSSCSTDFLVLSEQGPMVCLSCAL